MLTQKQKWMSASNKSYTILTLGWARRGKATLGSICAQTEKERERMTIRKAKSFECSYPDLNLIHSFILHTLIHPFIISYKSSTPSSFGMKTFGARMGHTGTKPLTLWLVILLISVCVQSAEGVQTERIIRETISCSNVTLSCLSLNTASYKEEFQTISYRQT